MVAARISGVFRSSITDSRVTTASGASDCCFEQPAKLKRTERMRMERIMLFFAQRLRSATRLLISKVHGALRTPRAINRVGCSDWLGVWDFIDGAGANHGR